MPGCLGWERALGLASLVREASLSGIEVRVVDLSRPGIAVPDAVVASPTWVLNGRRVALGNPDPDWLLDWLGTLAA